MTIYPGSIDTNTSLPLVIDDVTPVTAITVNRLRETLIAVETELGTDPSGGYSDVAARLTALEASGGAAHATTHEDGGSDELTIQNLGSGAAVANKVVVTDGAGGLTLQDYSSGIGSGTDRNIATWDAAGTGLRDNPIAIDSVGDIQWTAETGLSPERRIVIANATADGQYGTDLYLEPGDGGDSTSTTGGRGGRISLPAGNGGDTSSSGHFGGTGGNVTMGGGVGGKTDNATLRGGGGGLCSLIGGTGGQSTGSGRGGTGGQFLAAGGYGGDALGTGIGGPGGAVEIEGGRGGYGPTGTGGAGGDCTVKGGEGHIDGATAGGDLNLIGGEGYPYFAGGDGTGGNVVMTGGPVSGAGAGGDVSIDGGAGGTTNGTVNVGLSNTSAVNIGAISTPTTIYSATTTIEDPGANSYLDFASSEYIVGRTRYIRTVSPITAGYRGDSLTIEAGDGAAGGASGGQGGNAGLYSGDGGEAATAGNVSAQGGDITIRSGAGGWGNTSGGKPNKGGFVTIRAGDGGRIQSGSASASQSVGGTIQLLAGDGCLSLEATVAATAGGALIMEGGEGGIGYSATGDGGPGGTTTVQGGRAGQAAGSGNDGAGGSVQIDAGRNYSGAQGTVDLGYTDRWGASWASAIRCFVPTTIYNSLFIGSTTTSENFLDIEDGTGAAVSAAGDVRIRNNSGKLEVSEDGYAYAPLGYVDTGAAKTGAYSADIGELVKVDPSGGGFAVTLPTAIGYDNQGITVKNVTNSTNAVTFNTTGGQTIDGAASGTDQIDTAYETVTFISDGSNWMRFPAA